MIWLIVPHAGDPYLALHRPRGLAMIQADFAVRLLPWPYVWKNRNTGWTGWLRPW